MRSIFSRLHSYRPRENRNPEEDFFTEVFAGVMEKNRPFLAQLLGKWINESSEGQILDDDLTDFEIKTQVSYPSRHPSNESDRPDIVIEAKSKQVVIIIENKIGSIEGDNQLNRYAQQLEERWGADYKKILIYITLYPEEKNIADITDNTDNNTNIIFLQKRWYDVHQEAVKFKDNNHNQKGIIFLEEMINFMEEKKMALTLSSENLIAYPEMIKIDRILKDVLSDAWSHSKLKKPKEKLLIESFEHSMICICPQFEASKLLRVSLGFWFDRSNIPSALNNTNEVFPLLFVNIYTVNLWSDKTAAANIISDLKTKKTFQNAETAGWKWRNDRDYKGLMFTKQIQFDLSIKDNVAQSLVDSFRTELNAMESIISAAC